MKIYAISDLHLDLSGSKPMDIFGESWEGYLDKIREDWENKVTDEDIVLIPGDHSWAMDLDTAMSDFKFYDGLKGKKIIIRGNHDLWWGGIGKLRNALPEGFYALQNDSIRFDGYVFCGSRGWVVEGYPEFTEHDEKIYKREGERLRLSLKSAQKMLCEGDKLVVLMHYPPFNFRLEDTLFTKAFEEFKVDKVVFGHLHGRKINFIKDINKNGVEYLLCSCDQVDNKLIEIY